LTQDETFTDGLSLVGIAPVSNDILLEQAVQARDQDTWNALMEAPLAHIIVGNEPRMFFIRQFCWSL
jgi:hypothetical protein